MPEEQVDSLHDDLMATWEELNASEDQEKTDNGAAADSEEQPAADADGPAGDADAEVDAGGDSESEQESDQDEPVELKAPDHWANEDKEAFASLTDEAKKVVLARDARFQALYDERASHLTALEKYKPLDEIFEPVRARLAMQGMSEVEAVRTLLAAQQALEQDAPSALQYLARQYGVDLSSAVKAEGSEDDDIYADPHIKALQDQVQGLTTQLQGLTQSQQQQQRQSLEQQISSFRDAVDETGNKAHPHFETVRAHMGGLMQTGAAADLEQAYQMAVWAEPTLRESLLAQQREAEERRQKEERSTKAKEAKRSASKPNSGSKSQKPQKSDSDDDAPLGVLLRETAKELGML